MADHAPPLEPFYDLYVMDLWSRYTIHPRRTRELYYPRLILYNTTPGLDKTRLEKVAEVAAMQYGCNIRVFSRARVDVADCLEDWEAEMLKFHKRLKDKLYAFEREFFVFCGVAPSESAVKGASTAPDKQVEVEIANKVQGQNALALALDEKMKGLGGQPETFESMGFCCLTIFPALGWRQLEDRGREDGKDNCIVMQDYDS